MFLFKLHIGDIAQSKTDWKITYPQPVTGHSTPVAGDFAFIWAHEEGLFAECVILGYPEHDPSVVLAAPIARFEGRLLDSDWLSGADRDKVTIRSKLRCLRTSRSWHLSKTEIAEIDQARRDIQIQNWS